MRGLTVLVAATILSLAACRTIETKLPSVELPETSVQSLPDVERWWTQFNDPQLNALIEEAFAAHGFAPTGRRPQFFFPMALHRALGLASLSRGLEGIATTLGLRRLLGSPVILRLERRP